MADLEQEMLKMEKRLTLLKETNAHGKECVDEILSWEECLDEKKTLRSQLSFLHDIATDCDAGFLSFNGIYANID